MRAAVRCEPDHVWRQGYTGYRADAAVKSMGRAPGVYSYFRDYECLVPAAIVAPDTAEVTFMNASEKLRGHEGSASVERYEAAAWRAADARFQTLLRWSFPRKHEVLLDRAALVHVAVAREVRVRRRVVGPLRVARRRK